jgi:D-amino-acid dehydrogenase
MADRAPDVVVVGGGAIGISVAYFLTRRGADVVVVERSNGVGAACSYGNAGLVSPSHCIPLARRGILRNIPTWLRPGGPVYIKPRPSLELARFGVSMLRAAKHANVLRGLRTLRDHCRASRDLFDELTRDGLELGYRRDGLMNVCWTERGLRLLVEDCELLRREGFEPEVLSSAEARAREPLLRETVAGAAYWAEDGHCDPAMYTRAINDAAVAAGAETRLGEAVTRLRRGVNGRVTAVETGASTLRPRHVVVATGAWTPRLASQLGDRLPFQPGKGYHVHLADGGPPVSLPIIFQEHVVAITPMASGVRIAGTMDFVGFDPTLKPARAQRLVQDANRYMHGLDDTRAGSTWFGYRPCTPDTLPLVGASTRASNVIYASGHAMLGITLAPITGKAVADVITGAPPDIDLAPVSPARFG